MHTERVKSIHLGRMKLIAYYQNTKVEIITLAKIDLNKQDRLITKSALF